MKLWINGTERSFPDGITVKRWMELDQVRNPDVAIIHVNDRHITDGEWGSHCLREGDRLQLLYFLGDS